MSMYAARRVLGALVGLVALLVPLLAVLGGPATSTRGPMAPGSRAGAASRLWRAWARMPSRLMCRFR